MLEREVCDLVRRDGGGTELDQHHHPAETRDAGATTAASSPVVFGLSRAGQGVRR